jgi:hypothetical protein
MCLKSRRARITEKSSPRGFGHFSRCWIMATLKKSKRISFT